MAQVERAGSDFAGTPRFRVVRRLGAGGMGVVYEAWDAEHATAVALKTLRSLSGDRLLQFKNEFRALRDVTHPNLVPLHELHEHGGQWFFTMELVTGVSLVDWLRGGVAPPTAAGRTVTRSSSQDDNASAGTIIVDHPVVPPILDEARLRSALAQLARGLDAIHRRGKVHRDIKPWNVLVGGSGRVVILDFGLVADVVVDAGGAVATDDDRTGHRPRQAAARAAGTPAYMAPEQARGGAVGPAADWYAVGVILYEVCTGRLPFAGTAQEILIAKQHVLPIPPRTINPAMPAWLDALCMELLAADPERRPGSAEVLALLGEGRDVEALPATSMGFVGRAAELAVLDGAFAAAAAGPVTVVVRGESGIGKSALIVEWAARRRRDPDSAGAPLVLAGRCHERETVPYQAMDSVLDALAHALASWPVEDVRALLPPHAAALVRVFPALGAALGLDADAAWATGESVAPALRRRQLFAAVRHLVAALARRRRLVLVIDDLQWADADGLALLDHALAPADAAGPPVLLVVSQRSPASADVGRLPGDVRVMELAGLAPDDAAVLAERLMGDGGAALAAEAAGHPLFIAELARSRSHGPRPSRLEEALWRRVGDQGADAAALLEVIAVAGRPLTQRVAARAAGLVGAAGGAAGGSVSAVLIALGDAALIRTGGPRPEDAVDVFHARVRDAIVAHLDPEARRRRHRALAEALEIEAERDAEMVAGHWLEAGEPERALGHATAAAAQAAAALAFDRAARLYRTALGLAHGDQAHAIRLALGQCLADGGRGAEAAHVLLAAAEDLAAPGGKDLRLVAGAGSAPAFDPRALDLRRRAAEQLLRSGHVDEGLDTLRGVLAAVGLRLPRSTPAALARLLLLRLRVRLRGYRLAPALRPLDAAGAARIDTCWSAAVGLSMVDPARGAEFQTRMLLAALAAGDRQRGALGLALEAGHVAAGGHRERARVDRLLDRAGRVAQASGSPHAVAMAAGAAGVAAYLTGDFRQAVQRSDEAAAMFRTHCVGAAWERATSVVVATWARAYLGHHAELASRLDHDIAEAEDVDDRYLATSLQSGHLVLVPLVRGDADAACRAMAEAVRLWSHRDFLHQHWDHLLGQSEIDLYTGDAARAHARVAAGWRDLRRNLILMIQISRCEAWYLRGRAALAQVTAIRATSRSDARVLDAEIRRAIRVLCREAPWAVGLAALLDGGLAASLGDVTAAVHRLRAAIPALEDSGLALHQAMARRRLAGLVGGSEGGALMAAAHDYERREGIAVAARIADVLAPGFAGLR